MLDGTELSYFDDDGDKKGSIDLLVVVSIRNSRCPTAKGHEIEIETPDRTIFLRVCGSLEWYAVVILGQAADCVEQVHIAYVHLARARRICGCGCLGYPWIDDTAKPEADYACALVGVNIRIGNCECNLPEFDTVKRPHFHNQPYTPSHKPSYPSRRREMLRCLKSWCTFDCDPQSKNALHMRQ